MTARVESFASLTDGTYTATASAFETARAIANNGGADHALLYDTTGDDTLSGRVGSFARMRSTGVSTKYAQASLFESVDGNFSGDEDDDAILYDTTGNDTFTADSSWGYMRTSLSSALLLRVVLLADATDSVQIVSDSGGTDVTDIQGTLLYQLIETGVWN